jgi:hypothetical protein
VSILRPKKNIAYYIMPPKKEKKAPKKPMPAKKRGSAKPKAASVEKFYGVKVVQQDARN